MGYRDGGSEDTPRGRAGRNPLVLWVLVEADRGLVVAGLLGTVYLLLVLVGSLVPGAETLLGTADPVEAAFQSFITANITGVTLVVTLNQLVLSQELGGVGEQQDRMTAALEFRRETAATMDLPAPPPDPSTFLRVLVEQASDLATDLSDEIDEGADDDLQATVDRLATDVEFDAGTVGPRLADAEFGTYRVLSAALDFDYSWKLYEARRLRAEHGDELGETALEHLAGLTTALERFGTTREHVKTLYFRWELVELSLRVIAATVPSLVVAVCTLLYYDHAALAGSVAGIPVAVLVVSGSVTVSILPFGVLLAYILRIVTITKRTLSIGPFTLRPTEYGTFDGEEE